MTKVKTIKAKAEKATKNNNVVQALIAYFLELSWHPGDYTAATKEAAYNLEVGDEKEFKRALKAMNQSLT